jgi:hypothetical protein
VARCLRERLEPVAPEHLFTTIADFGSKGALYWRFRPKDAPLAVQCVVGSNKGRRPIVRAA